MGTPGTLTFQLALFLRCAGKWWSRNTRQVARAPQPVERRVCKGAMEAPESSAFVANETMPPRGLKGG